MREITYYAIIGSEKDCIRNGGDIDGDEFSIMFPDLPCAYTCADTHEEAIKNASNVLEFALVHGPSLGEEISPPSTLSKIKRMIRSHKFKDFLDCMLSYELVPITVST